MLKLNFAETLRIAIERDGRKHIDIAHALEISSASVSNYLSGKYIPTDFRIIQSLEKGLNLRAGSLQKLADEHKGSRRRKPVAA